MRTHNVGESLSEAAFQAQIIDYARLTGWRVAHFHDSRRQVQGRLVGDVDAAGWPDLTLVRDGRLVFAELKTERGKLSTAQEEWIGALCEVERASIAHMAGLSSGLYRPRVQVYVWRPRDWLDIERILAR